MTCGCFVAGLAFMLAWLATCGDFYDRGLLDGLGATVAIAVLFGGLFVFRRIFLAALPDKCDAEG